MWLRLGANRWLKDKWAVFWEDGALKDGDAPQDNQGQGEEATAMSKSMCPHGGKGR